MTARRSFLRRCFLRRVRVSLVLAEDALDGVMPQGQIKLGDEAAAPKPGDFLRNATTLASRVESVLCGQDLGGRGSGF